MKSNIYVIRDKVADDIVLLSMCKTDGLFVRQNLPFLSKLNPNFMEDTEILCIGEFVDSSMSISPSPARLHHHSTSHWLPSLLQTPSSRARNRDRPRTLLQSHARSGCPSATFRSWSS